jgi:serine/threonine protein phosphatase PrpC
MEHTAQALDAAFLQQCQEQKLNAGSTALGALLRGRELTVFNIGDCHAVLCSRGVCRDLSVAHKPGRPEERDRILRANGWITEEKELYMGRLHLMDIADPLVRRLAEKISFVTIHRVCGDLAVTRSIGDPDYKRVVPGAPVSQWFPWPEQHSTCFLGDLVIATPECVRVQLGPGDEFMVLASDGLWDVVSGPDAVLVAQEALQSGRTCTQAAEQLCELALRLGSSDNVTVIIVQFAYS